MTRKIPIVAAALALAGTTGAAEYFVAADGCDQADGSAARPWRTIQRAADVAQAGDTVTIRGGIYRELYETQFRKIIDRESEKTE